MAGFLKISTSALCCVLVLLLALQTFEAFSPLRQPPIFRLHSSLRMELDVGEYENVDFTKLETISDAFGKYRMEVTIKASEMNESLEAYKKEMQRRKVSFPGFRAGKLPPYVMPDVRKYLVCFGMESILGQVCNLNSLEMCDKNEKDVDFGSDEYYEQIIQNDFREYNYTQQRDTWREGTDLTFIAEFFAKDFGDTDAEDVSVADAEEAADVAIDAETVDTE